MIKYGSKKASPEEFMGGDQGGGSDTRLPVVHLRYEATTCK